MDQMSCSDAEYGARRNQTRRQKLPANRDKVIPWRWLQKRIEPFYRKTGGHPPYPLPVLRLSQRLANLAFSATA